VSKSRTVAGVQLSTPLIDFDNHYYEPDDCITRHIERKYRDRAVHCVRSADGHGEWFFGDRPLRYHPFARDAVLQPGDLRAVFAGLPPGSWKVTPSDDPIWRHPGARLEAMDEQGVSATVVLPTFGVAFEPEISDDVEADYANMRSFNRWVEEEWGFARGGRLFAPPYLPMLDPDLAVAELDSLLERGARLVLMRPGPATYGKSPADPVYDPIWARLEEAGVPAVYHVSLTPYFDLLGPMWGENVADMRGEGTVSPFLFFLGHGARPIADTIASLITRGLFDRFPKLKVVSLENGVGWVKDVMKLERMYKTKGDAKPGEEHVRLGRVGGVDLKRLPAEVLRTNVHVAPFHEERFRDIVDLVGASQVLYGSDWPHPEGTTSPRAMLDDLDGLSADEVAQVVYENPKQLLKL
jgi:predicted TIM-barrel fold metal-dependent hydrolase